MRSRDLLRRACLGLLLLCTAWLVVENVVVLTVIAWSRAWPALGTVLPPLGVALALTTLLWAGAAAAILAERATRGEGRRARAAGWPGAAEERDERA